MDTKESKYERSEDEDESDTVKIDRDDLQDFIDQYAEVKRYNKALAINCISLLIIMLSYSIYRAIY